MLTKRQKAILDFIRNELRTRGYPPSIREIAAAVGLSSTAAVYNNLKKLEELNIIRRDPSKTRSIEIIQNETRDFDPSSISMKTDSAESPMKGQTFGFELSADTVLQWKERDYPSYGVTKGDYILIKKQDEFFVGDPVVIECSNATLCAFVSNRNNGKLILKTPDTDEEILASPSEIIGKIKATVRMF
ncbi:MAG TPA: hypothetical protein PLN69_08425 [bacterium]|nr:hypothetical protein [bacterium]